MRFLIMTIISAGDAILVQFYKKCLRHAKLYISIFMTCAGGVVLGSAVDSKGPGPRPSPGHGAKHGPYGPMGGLGEGGGTSSYLLFAHYLLTICRLIVHDLPTIHHLFTHCLQTICPICSLSVYYFVTI